VHIADAPIELQRGVFRCLSIVLHLGFELTDSSPRRCVLRVLSTLMRVVYLSASATGHRDMLHEDDLVDFFAVDPRLDDAEPDVDFFAAGRGRVGDESLDVDFFAAGRGRVGDESLDVDFFAAGRGRLDVVAAGVGFFAELLAVGPDADPRSEL
jgi:hypothetical protein